MITEDELQVLINTKANTAGFVSATAAGKEFEAATARLNAETAALTATQERHLGVLQTANQFHLNYGGTLTKEEERYARLQLSSKEFQTAERDLVSEGGNLARMFGSVGAEGEHAFARIGAAVGSVAGAGTAGLAIGAGLIAGGLAVEVGKSAIENAEAQEKALKALHQAADVSGQDFDKLNSSTQNWITTNRSFVKDQFEAERVMAMFTRAGNDQATSTKAMGAALDFASLKNISLTDAGRMVELAMMGNGRAVRELGIDLKSLTASQDVTETATKTLEKAQANATAEAAKLANAQRALQIEEDTLHGKRVITKVDLDHLKEKQDAVAKAQEGLNAANAKVKETQDALGVSQKKSAEVLDELSGKVASGRDTTTELEQANNRLHNTWQKLTADQGPSMIGMLGAVADRTDKVLNGMHDWADSAAPAVNNALVPLAQKFHEGANATDNGQRSMMGYTYSVKEAGPAIQYAALRASEHADILDHGTLVTETAKHATDEHADSLSYLQEQYIKNRDESFNVAAANERVRNELQAQTVQTQLASHAWDEHNQSAREADRQLYLTNQSVQNIRESIAHANSERLDIKVSDASLQALKAELQGIFNQEYVAHFRTEHNPYDGSGGPNYGGSDFQPT